MSARKTSEAESAGRPGPTDADLAATRDGLIIHGLNGVVSLVGGIALTAMMVYVVANALSRTLWNSPFGSSLEIVQYLMMPVVATMGFVAAQAARQHVTTEIMFGLFPPVGRKWLLVGVEVLSATVLLLLSWFTLDHALFAQERGFRAGYTDIPSWPVYFLIPLALVLCAGLMLRDAWRAVRAPAHVTEEVLGESELPGEAELYIEAETDAPVNPARKSGQA